MDPHSKKDRVELNVVDKVNGHRVSATIDLFISILGDRNVFSVQVCKAEDIAEAKFAYQNFVGINNSS
uniref:Uncharacterized protein n=1 Tax=Glossina palpalis gambiensis TaxID=67801 RepID=A0A1B0B0H3_9MUSC